MTFALKGGSELLSFLDQLPPRLATNVVRGGLRAGAKVIADEAKVLVRKKSGLTAASIKVSTGTKQGVIRATVKTSGKHAWLAPLLERGVSPHFITVADEDRPVVQTRRGPRARTVKNINDMSKRGSLVINGKFVGDTVFHPGFAPHPFMRPALDQKAKEAVNAVGRYISTRLAKGQLSAPTLEAGDDE